MKNGSGKEFIGKSVSVGAWVRSGRLAEKDSLAFLSLSDGTWFVVFCCFVVLLFCFLLLDEEMMVRDDK